MTGIRKTGNSKVIPGAARGSSAINPANLRSLCMLNQMTISELARRIGRSRLTVYRAVKKPSTFPRAYRRIEAALTKRN